MIGIVNNFSVMADVTIAASTTLVTVGLLCTIAAGQSAHIRAWVPFNVGATGGIKCQFVGPAAPADVWASYKILDGVTPALVAPTINNNANAFANAFAVAGNSWMEIEAFWLNGANAGTIDLQFACNSAANALVVQRGGWMSVVKY